MANAQTNKAGTAICWDFASHGGCGRGAKRANAHGNMTAKNIHWGVKCELARRGGLRSEKRIIPDDVDGVIRQLTESNKRTEGLQKEMGSVQMLPPGLGEGKHREEISETNKSDTTKSNGVSIAKGEEPDERTWGAHEKVFVRKPNPAAPGAPGDVIAIKFTPMEGDCRKILGADEDWVYPAIEETEEVCDASDLSDKQMKIDKWWGENPPNLDQRITPFLKNWLAVNSPGNAFDTCLAGGLQFLVSHGTARCINSAKNILQSQGVNYDSGKAQTEKNVCVLGISPRCGDVQDSRNGNWGLSFSLPRLWCQHKTNGAKQEMPWIW